jgi:N-acetylglucosamine-6-phosphate deacetylase
MAADGSLQARILTPHGFVDGFLEYEGARIRTVGGTPVPAASVREGDRPIALPGFIDPHVHGGGGADVMDAGAAVNTIAHLHARHGTTSMLATTMTAPLDEIRGALTALRATMRAPDAGTARVLGAHLEGPFINPGKLGAQPDFVVSPVDRAELHALHQLAPIRLITLAPELPGMLDAIAWLRAAGFQVQIGHTLGTYEDGLAALARGACGFTHLFNAMSGMHHRAPGIVGAALAHAHYSEIIPDLLHVHPGAIRAALRAIPCLYCVTDSTSATGMPDGEYRLGRHTVTKCLGGVRLADGTLAGSTLTMDQALRNLVELGLDLEDAAKRVSTHAADYLGIHDRGRLAAGAYADIVLLDRDLRITRVLVEGEAIALEDA